MTDRVSDLLAPPRREQRPEAAGVLTFEVTGANITELVDRAHAFVTQFADGMPYTLDPIGAESYVSTGAGQTLSYRADCTATIWGALR